MYPSTKFIIEDRSAITSIPTSEQLTAPMFMQVFASDKGPEELKVCYGEEFENYYGKPNFAKYGQPLLQAQTLINNGANVLAKRIVASDATLANIVVLAKSKMVTSQKTDDEGRPLYTTPSGEESTESDGNTAIMVNRCRIEYELRTFTGNTNSIEELKASALALADINKGLEEEKTYPLFIIADNGRGVSSKKFKITSNITGSRNTKYLSYIFSVIEDSNVTESTVFTLNPDLKSSTSNLSLDAVAKTYLKQIRAFTFDDILLSFIEEVKNASGEEDIDNIDILFGKDKKGKSLTTIEITGNVNLSITTGITLQSGYNGSFGVAPLRSESYKTELVNVFNGTFSKDIYDVDNIALHCILDANYPEDAKKAIESLVNFREDCVYLRDIGTGVLNEDDILSKADNAYKSKYISLYGNSWDIIDPYSLKQVTVTACYNLAKKLPKHLAEKSHSPLAGQLHGFTFDDIIEGTVNFLPKVIPGKNQKESLFEKRVNFISYFKGVPIMESEYTTQENYSGFSYINNTIAIQDVIRDIREHCPKSRYSFMEEDDLTKYQEDVQVILDKHKHKFSELSMEYVGDPTYEQNMVFYAVIKVKFKKFVQAEVFRIIAIGDDDTTSNI